MNYSTNWAEATTSPAKAIKNLISCLQNGNDAFIVTIENEKAKYPIKIKNPDLDYHDNWEMSYGEPASLKALEKQDFFNDVQKDLTLNYEYSFNHYRCKNGHLFLWNPKEKRFCPMCGLGIADLKQECKPVKLKNPKTRTWITHWKPKNDIPWLIPAKLDTKVFVVAYYQNSKPVKAWQKLLILLAKPLKFIPTKTVLDMGNYKNITYRIGGVSNGYSFEIQMPKRFSFKD